MSTLVDQQETPSAHLGDLDFSDLYWEPSGEAWFKRYSHDPQRHEVDGALLDEVKRLVDQTKKVGKPDFRLPHAGRSLRGRVLPVLSGDVVVLRRLMLASEVPDFASLYPAKLVDGLMSADLASGGLVLFTGPTGSGKTVSAVSMVMARLLRFGGVGTSIENPIEIDFEGRYRSGDSVCGTMYQTEVDDDLAFGPQIQARSRVAPNVLFIGEIRTAAAMAQALIAAMSGVLVIATFHAQAVVSGIERIRAMVKDAGYDAGLFSNGIAAIVHQTMVRTELPGGVVKRTLTLSPLIVRGALDGKGVQGQLMQDDLRPLESIIDRQRRAMINPSMEVPL
ncbi:ATPase, T2SS/T4P/T4SS family [Burkholderia glumae]|uniref:ATPase, T2SS/T4P/T4SS family n=1 Tax=Burkholderia glumae TaxID=337 RepID=UPI002151169D|nr:ATPase, T2SS/T4P/T4SS family [Burkholderia glumae]